MKIFGAVLMIAGAAISGLYSVKRLRKRVRFLSAITDSLEMLKNEICTSLLPIGEIFDEMSYNTAPCIRGLFCHVSKNMNKVGEMLFSDIWKEAVESECGTILTREEIGCLVNLGMALGRYDEQWQAEAIDRTILRFDSFASEAAKIRDKDSKVHAVLGLSAGILAVIVLI